MDIEELLLCNGCEGAVRIPYPSFDASIVGISDDGRIIYDYEELLEETVRNNHLSVDEAVDCLDGIIRFIPVMGNKPPIIMYRLER